MGFRRMDWGGEEEVGTQRLNKGEFGTDDGGWDAGVGGGDVKGE